MRKKSRGMKWLLYGERHFFGQQKNCGRKQNIQKSQILYTCNFLQKKFHFFPANKKVHGVTKGTTEPPQMGPFSWIFTKLIQKVFLFYKTCPKKNSLLQNVSNKLSPLHYKYASNYKSVSLVVLHMQGDDRPQQKWPTC